MSRGDRFADNSAQSALERARRLGSFSHPAPRRVSSGVQPHCADARVAAIVRAAAEWETGRVLVRLSLWSYFLLLSIVARSGLRQTQRQAGHTEPCYRE